MKIVDYSHRTTFTGKKLYVRFEDGSKEPIAEFAKGEQGTIAFGLFTGGLASTTGGLSLFNEDSGQYDIGTMGELVA